MRYAITDEKGYIDMCLTNLDGLYELIKGDFTDVAFPFDNFNIYGEKVKAENQEKVLYMICSIREQGKAPLFFMLYIGNERKLRAYIPKKGNNIVWKDGKIHSADEMSLDLKKIEDDFYKHVVIIDRTPEPVCRAILMEDFEAYTKRFGNELTSYVKRYANMGLAYGLTMDLVKEIEFIDEVIMKPLRCQFVKITLNEKDKMDVYGIAYINSKGGMSVYIPIQGNTIDRRNRTIFNKNVSKVYVSKHKMLEEFKHTVSVDTSHKNVFNDFLTGDLMKWNGVPSEEYANERSSLGVKGSKKQFLDLEKELFDFHEIYEEAVEERFGDMDYEISGEGKIDFRDVWVREVDVKFDNYLPIKVHCYYNVDGELKSYIPAHHNNLYKGELIPKGYETPYINLDKAGIGDIERYIAEIKTKEIRNARPYGFIVLDKIMGDMKAVAEKYGIANPSKLYRHKHNKLECYIMEHSNGMTAIYVDMLGRVKTFDIDNVSEADEYIFVTDIENDEFD